jgi:hypothetical protein
MHVVHCFLLPFFIFFVFLFLFLYLFVCHLARSSAPIFSVTPQFKDKLRCINLMCTQRSVTHKLTNYRVSSLCLLHNEQISITIINNSHKSGRSKDYLSMKPSTPQGHRLVVHKSRSPQENTHSSCHMLSIRDFYPKK